jgi:hypothetical protein
LPPRRIDKTRLAASGICDAIIRDCSTEAPKRTPEAKARQVERILTNSSRAGYSRVLMIEEALAAELGAAAEPGAVKLRHTTIYPFYRRAGLVLAQKARSFTVTASQLAELEKDVWVEIER